MFNVEVYHLTQQNFTWREPCGTFQTGSCPAAWSTGSAELPAVLVMSTVPPANLLSMAPLFPGSEMYTLACRRRNEMFCDLFEVFSSPHNAVLLASA